MISQSELHNRLAPIIVDNIVTPIYETGGTPADVWILTESVVLGVLLYLKSCTTPGTDLDITEIVETMTKRVMDRLKQVEALNGKGHA